MLRRLGSITVAALLAVGYYTVAVAPASASTVPLAAAAQESGDDFYVPPSPLPEGKPGDIIRSRQSAVGWPSAKAKAWQVMYLSTDALGEPAAMTGTVLVPNGADPAKTQVVAFGPGTQGPGFHCAPSEMIRNGSFYEQSGLNDLLNSGYAVAVPDYEGYRPEGDTTYVVGHSMGPAMIDATRAAMRLPAAGLSAEAKVAFRGYSQGGGAAMWAGELQPEYAPELNLVGVSAGGIPADLVQVALGLNGKQGFGLLATALIGLDNAYPELKLDSYLNEAGRTAFADIENKCVDRLLIEYPGKTTDDYMERSPLVDQAWVKRYDENKLGSTPPKVPVFQYHATKDQLVQFGQGKKLRDTYCAAGVKVTWKEYERDHLGVVYHGNADALAFIKDRMSGVEAGSNC